MRKSIIAAVATVSLGVAGALVWQAEAAGAGGAVPHHLSGPISLPVHPAACNGSTGRYGCRPGFTRRCNAYRCWCGPC